MSESFNSCFWEYLDQLVDQSEVVIDRPKDSTHPDYDDHIYPLDYGYLAGTTSSDGAGIDVWIGSGDTNRVNGIVCTVDLLKRDTEIKLLMGCTEDEMAIVTDFFNNSMMGCWLIQR